jgi:hypothetical protein
MKTDKYYGYADPKIPDNNKGMILKGEFYSADESSMAGGYYKRQMAANEFKDYIGPRVLANNERAEDEQLDPRIIDTSNLILQHLEKLKTRVRDKYRRNNIAFKNKQENVVIEISYICRKRIWSSSKFTRL